MQFFLLDLAVAFVALLGYRALSLVVRHKAAVMSLELRGTPHRGSGGTHIGIVPPLALRKAAPGDVAPAEVAAPKDAPCSDRCRSTLHRLINFW